MTTSNSDGAQTVVPGTVHDILSANATDANFQIIIDLNAMAVGDIFAIVQEQKVRSVGTNRQQEIDYYAHSQENPVVSVEPTGSINEITVSIQQVQFKSTITSMTGTVAVGDDVTGDTSTGTGTVIWMDDAGTPTEAIIRWTGVAPFQDGEQAEKDVSNYLVLNDATPAYAVPWEVYQL